MLRRILLTIPALLVGPAAVLIVFVLGYDWSITGAAMTALIVSISAVAAVWRGKPEPGNTETGKKAGRFMIMGIAGIAVGIGIALAYPDAFEKPSEHAALLMGPGQQLIGAENCDFPSNASSGLDRPFLVPDEDHLESFPMELSSSIEELAEDERKEVSDAISFLMFALGMHLSEQDPDAFENISDSDMIAKTLVKLYRFAQDHGSCMTLRKYIGLAQEFKHQKPEWWGQYQASSEPPHE